MMNVPFAKRFTDPAGSPIRELFRYLGKPGIISFAGGYPSPALLDAEGLAEASMRSWSDPAASLQYGPTEGNPELRAALAELSSGRGVACDAEQVLVTTGSQQAFDILVRIFIEAGDAVVVEAPAYPAAIQSLRMAGARILQIPVDDGGLQVDQLASMLRSLPVADYPKLLYTVPTFSNPAGTLLSSERREALVRLAVEYGFVIVEDDPYGELHFGKPAPATLYEIGQSVAGMSHPVIYLSSLSKTVAPSLRVGWMVGPADVLRRCVIAKQTMDLCTSPLAQLIAVNYLGLGRYPAAVLRARTEYAARMQAMTCEIDQQLGGRLVYIRPGGGMFIWASTSGAIDAGRLFQASVDAGVLYVPGSSFFAEQPRPGTMRLSYAAPDIPAIREGVTRLAAAFHQLHE